MYHLAKSLYLAATSKEGTTSFFDRITLNTNDFS